MNPQVQTQNTQQAKVGTNDNTQWYKDCVFYQIYPKSFKDTNNDGIGDLNGIIEKLDYLVTLGIGAFWLNPIFASSMYDNGYDITNYYEIDKSFGTIDDFKNLIQKSHNKNLKIMIDFVPSHTSIKHPWFEESRSSLTNPKRNWYIWKDPKKDGSEPNNWLSFLSKEKNSAWEYDERTGQYYLHSNMVEQPDLNWRNPEVKEEMFKILRYWLSLGIDGVRIDTVNRLNKDEDFRDEPINPDYIEGKHKQVDMLIHKYSENQLETISIIEQMSKIIGEYGSKLVIGEAYPQTNYDKSNEFLKKLSIIPLYNGFNFVLKEEKDWDIQKIKNHVESYYENLPSDVYPNFVLGNHDGSRLVTRLGDGLARVAAFLLLTLKGMPFIYNGDELGLSNSTEFYDNRDPEKRDVARTPFPWNSTPGGGFSDIAPWIPLDKSHIKLNVEDESADPHSMLSLYKALISYRNTHEVIRIGSYKMFDVGEEDVYAYSRSFRTEEVIVLLNFSAEEKKLNKDFIKKYKIVLNTFLDISIQYQLEPPMEIHLRPYEGVLMEKIKLV